MSGLAAIVAMTRSGLMGRGLDLPWRWPEDLRHFKRTTKGHVVIMGRRTFDSLAGQFGGPLKQRLNLVVSRRAGGEGVERAGALWFSSLATALACAREQAGRATLGEAPEGGWPAQAFLLGGAELFAEAWRSPQTSPERLVVTWVPEVPEQPGDTYFPHRPPEPWIEARYRAAARWRAEEAPLEFVDYRARP